MTAARQTAPTARRHATRTGRVADGVYRVLLGSGVTAANAYLVRSGPTWALIDTGWPGHGEEIRAAARSRLGTDAPPAAILLTHSHSDHAGSAVELARAWGVAVHVHPGELPLTGPSYLRQYANPLDRRIVEPVLALLPAGRRDRMLAAGDMTSVVRPLDPDGAVPGLPDWEWVATPGHTPGHVAFFRRADRLLITGDALLTVDLNSARGVLRAALGRPPTVGAPPWYTTWNRQAAVGSIAAMARLDPATVATGHGEPIAGPGLAAAMLDAADADHRLAAGFFRAVDYSGRRRYRRTPASYLRMQWLGPLLTGLGIGPAYAVTLEVPGRRTGVIRRTTLVRTDLDGEGYLVALAGESQWVRNVRAAGGAVVIGRRQRVAATLVEVPPDQRVPVIRAYLLRAGRRAGSRAVTNEARHYFGLGPDPSGEEIARVVDRYPAFRIVTRATPGP